MFAVVIYIYFLSGHLLNHYNFIIDTAKNLRVLFPCLLIKPAGPEQEEQGGKLLRLLFQLRPRIRSQTKYQQF
jgi:hypothetical protein